MKKAFTGHIISNQLGNMGSKKYGFIGLKTKNKEELKIKISAFTKYDTLDVGERVRIEAESIGKFVLKLNRLATWESLLQG
ncbi:MAG: hypothetical protein ACW99G_24470 [Candidatus Thorarchaeota archaeon]|jgi:hypothetical protein